MTLYVLGINHRSAPLEVRERVAVAPDRQPDALADLIAQAGVAEAVLVSTCNRPCAMPSASPRGSTPWWWASRRSSAR